MHRLHTACRAGDAMLAINLATEDTIDQKDESGLTAVCHAITAGHLEIALQLINQNANVSGESAQDLRSNIIYQAVQYFGNKKLSIFLQTLLSHFDTLTFTDGTKKYHLQLALQLIINHEAAALNHPIYNKPDDRLAFWIKTNYFQFAVAEYLTPTNLLNEVVKSVVTNRPTGENQASRYIAKAVYFLEQFNPSTDQELKDYLSCLRLLLESTKNTSSNKENLLVITKMFDACETIQSKDELTARHQAINALNLGDIYYVSQNIENAKKYYLIALEQILLAHSEKCNIVTDKIPELLSSLKLCFPKESQVRHFYEMASKYFSTNEAINDTLINAMQHIIDQTIPDADMMTAIAVVIKTLRHVHNLGLLINQALNSLMDVPVTKQCIDEILNLIEDKKAFSATLELPEKVSAQQTQPLQHSVFFPSSNPIDSPSPREPHQQTQLSTPKQLPSLKI